MGETEGLRKMTANEMWAQALLKLMPDDYPKPAGLEVTALGSEKREFIVAPLYVPQE